MRISKVRARRRKPKREDVDAATFVEKVLQQRDQDHVKAWRSFMEATKSKYVDESHRDDGSTSLIPGPRLRLLLDGLGSEVTPEQEAAARAAVAPVEAGQRHRKEIADTHGSPGALDSPAKARSPVRSPSPTRSPSKSPGSPIRSPGGSRRFPGTLEGTL